PVVHDGPGARLGVEGREQLSVKLTQTRLSQLLARVVVQKVVQDDPRALLEQLTSLKTGEKVAAILGSQATEPLPQSAHHLGRHRDVLRKDRDCEVEMSVGLGKLLETDVEADGEVVVAIPRVEIELDLGDLPVSLEPSRRRQVVAHPCPR